MKFILTNEKSNYLKGLAIILILLGHLGVIRYGGTIGVGLFLLLSGYGLYGSYTKKGLDKYWSKRVTKVLIPYWIFNTIWIIIDIILKQRPSITAIFTSYLTYKNTIDVTMWYISFLMIWYILFYIIFKISKKKVVQGILLLISTIITLVLSNLGFFGVCGGAQFYVLMFPLGIVLYELFTNYQEKINKYILPFMVITLAALLYIYNNSFNDTLTYIKTVIMIFSIVTLITLVTGYINFNILKYDPIVMFGKYSYFIYLIEGVILNKYNYMDNITTNKLLYSILFILPVLFLGVITQKTYDIASKKITEDVMKKIKLSNIFLVGIVSIILIGGFIKTIVSTKEINEYENRTAYNYEKPTIKTIINKEFQDNIELTLGDQIPMATTMKKAYNAMNTSVNYTIMHSLVKNNCANKYINMLPGITTYGCTDVIVYEPVEVNTLKETIDYRITNINDAIKNSKADVYVYYIEKDNDIDFTTNKKTGSRKYILDNIQTESKTAFEINDFEEYTKYYYETDHHWNEEGSYKGYLELTELLNLKKPLAKGEKQCLLNSYTGSKGSMGGADAIYKEDFCIYKIEKPKHTITINGDKFEKYSINDISELGYVSYANAYGYDYAEIIIDYEQPKKENILLMGNSYDNAILELIASHYNKTYSIDLRYYESEFNKKFNYKEYIKEHDIDKVVFIGDVYLFVGDEFIMEVE